MTGFVWGLANAQDWLKHSCNQTHILNSIIKNVVDKYILIFWSVYKVFICLIYLCWVEQLFGLCLCFYSVLFDVSFIFSQFSIVTLSSIDGTALSFCLISNLCMPVRVLPSIWRPTHIVRSSCRRFMASNRPRLIITLSCGGISHCTTWVLWGFLQQRRIRICHKHVIYHLNLHTYDI